MMFPYEHLSPSSINRYLQCPLKFLYDKEGKEKIWDERYVITGSYIHKCIEYMYTGDPVDLIQLDAEMQKRYESCLIGWKSIATIHGLHPGMGEVTKSTHFRTFGWCNRN